MYLYNIYIVSQDYGHTRFYCSSIFRCNVNYNETKVLDFVKTVEIAIKFTTMKVQL